MSTPIFGMEGAGHEPMPLSQAEVLGRIDFLPIHPLALDLAWHAAEDEGRTYDATEGRIRKAREEDGKVFLTQELPQALEVLLGFSTVAVLGVYYWHSFRDLMIRYLENPNGFVVAPGNVQALLTELFVIFLKMFLPVAGVALVAVISSTILQTQFHFSTRRLNPDFGKLVPTWNNLVNKTIFGHGQWWNTAKMVIKMVLLLATGIIFLVFRTDEIVLLINADPLQGFVKTSWMAYELVAVLSVILLGVAIPDWFLQRSQFMEQLKMSFQQLKEEVKEYEGDPQIKQRQQQRAREMASRNVAESVRQADVVVRNPTHFAVALKYEMGGNAPKVTAKGEDAVALTIIRLAEENDVPVHENRPLARLLYAKTEVGDTVPGDMLRAVVEIYATLEKFKQRFAQSREAA